MYEFGRGGYAESQALVTTPWDTRLQLRGLGMKQRIFSGLAGASRPFIRLASLVLRRRQADVLMQHPTKIAAYPSGDPELRTPLDKVVAKLDYLSHTKVTWSKMPPDERARLARRCAKLAHGVAERLAEREVQFKGAYETADGDPLLAWYTVPKYLNDLANTLDKFARGKQRVPLKVRERRAADGSAQAVVRVFPETLYDHLVFPGWEGELWIKPDTEPTQGVSFARGCGSHRGELCAVFGAGNQVNVAAMDVAQKVLADSCVVVCKMNPVNEYAGPLLEEVFSPLVQVGAVQFVYGGAEIGQLLTAAEQVDSIHMTGSHHTHDAIVWQGQPKVGTPPLTKRVDSELGCVSPVLVVPGKWTDKELDEKAADIVAAVVNNASFNCLAAKCVLVARGWDLRERFLKRIEYHLQACSARACYYPGSKEKYDAYMTHYPHAKLLGVERAEGACQSTVRWALARGVEAAEGEFALVNEPWCGVLTEVVVDCGNDPVEFITKAAHVANEQMWGTLSCGVYCDPGTHRRHQGALEELLASLQYGCVVLNGTGLVGFALTPLTWGGFVGRSTLHDVQSGIGIVHNSFLVDNVQKSVLRVPWAALPFTNYWDHRHRNVPAMGRHLVAFGAKEGFLNFVKVAWAALRG